MADPQSPQDRISNKQWREIGVWTGVLIVALNLLLVMTGIGLFALLIVNIVVIAAVSILWPIAKRHFNGLQAPVEAEHGLYLGIDAVLAATGILVSLFIAGIMLALGEGTYMIGVLPLIAVIPGFFFTISALTAVRVAMVRRQIEHTKIVDIATIAVSVLWAANLAYWFLASQS